MGRRLSKVSVDAFRELSFAGLKASSAIIRLVQDRGILQAVLQPRLGWERIRKTLTDDVRSNTRLKYRPRYPWPQPSPFDFEGLAQTVMNVPDEEVQEFLDTVVARYVRTLRRFWFDAASYAWRHPAPGPVPDEELGRLFFATPASRFLCPFLDERDRTAFAAVLPEDFSEKKFFKVDFSALQGVPALPGMYLAPTITLFEKPEGADRLVPRGIWINEMLLRPEDTEAWALARYFVLQGASLCLLAGIHPAVHFPMDAINALTKSLLDPRHPVRRLLEPHFYLQLPLNYAVLHIDRSVAHNDQREIYTPFPVAKEGFFSIMRAYHRGIVGNSAYPAYRFPLEAPRIPSPYGSFLGAYFAVILDFTRKVTSAVSPEDERLKLWADHSSRAVPGFPDGKAILRGENLARALASFICDVSVIHSADHFGYAHEPQDRMPLRLRVPPPSSRRMGRVEARSLVHWEDVFRQRMAWEMYFRPSMIRRLVDVRYDLERDEDREAARELLRDLETVDSRFSGQGFIPLEEIASSIQY